MTEEYRALQYEVLVSEVEYLRLGGLPLAATIYRPRGLAGGPALVDVHGGAWTTGDRSGDRNVAFGLAQRGVTVMSPDFRVAPQAPYPAQVQDVHYAVRWLKAHAEELAIESNTVGAFGSSSGGHTAMLVGMRPTDSRYAAHTHPSITTDAQLAYVLAGWPVLDPYTRYFFAIETGRADLVSRTDGYFSDQEQMREGNPQMILDRAESVDLPPALLLQGTADTNLTMAMALKFVASYLARGGNARLEQFPGMPHNFCTEASTETARAIDIMRTFIAAHTGQ